MELYGNLINRLSEGRTVDEITEGMDITMYYWSDRHCYYVTKVVDQKHIFVKEYEVVADHDAPSMSNTWKYFKTRKEAVDYLKNYFPNKDYYTEENGESEWVFRYGKWYSVSTWTKEEIEKYNKENAIRFSLTDKEQSTLDRTGSIKHYYKLQPVSFGVRNYHYDYEF